MKYLTISHVVYEAKTVMCAEALLIELNREENIQSQQSSFPNFHS
jgi:hypothetical protein